MINDPSLGKHHTLPLLPATPLSPSRTLKGFFELTRHPSRALNLLCALLLELQRNKDSVRCAALSPEVPGCLRPPLLKQFANNMRFSSTMQIVASMSTNRGGNPLTTRFTSILRIVGVGQPDKEYLEVLCSSYLSAVFSGNNTLNR